MKERFLKLLRSVDRVGIDNLAVYIEQETDFFSAPASTQYHGACEGGLLEHSIRVYENLIQIADIYLDGYTSESLILCSLLHDLCKANFYKIEYRNRKNEFGQWEKYPYYAIDDQLPFGHGEKSVIMAMKYIKLTDEEIAAINWHMGSFDCRTKDYAGVTTLSAAMGKYPLLTALHMADLAACYFDGK
jgi:hypothetical protein